MHHRRAPPQPSSASHLQISLPFFPSLSPRPIRKSKPITKQTITASATAAEMARGGEQQKILRYSRCPPQCFRDAKTRGVGHPTM